MNLTVYNRKDALISDRIGFFSINANSKSGRLTFSNSLSRMMKLEPGKYVTMARDDDSNEWYIGTAGDNTDGFKVMEKRRKALASGGRPEYPGFYFVSMYIAREMLDPLGDDMRSATFLVNRKSVNVGGSEWWKVIPRPLRANEGNGDAGNALSGRIKIKAVKEKINK